MLVAGVVVIIGYASGLGLRTGTPAAQAPAQTQQPGPGLRTPATGDLPQAQVPDITLPGDDLSTPPADSVVDVPPTPGSELPMPVMPGMPGMPGMPKPAPPVTPPSTPAVPAPACLPGLAQNVADTANTVVAGLPAVADLTGTVGLTQSPDLTNPGALNLLLYGITGYCVPVPGQPAPDPVAGTTQLLQTAVAPRVTSLLGG